MRAKVKKTFGNSGFGAKKRLLARKALNTVASISALMKIAMLIALSILKRGSHGGSRFLAKSRPK
jgi:hypothetical protein